MTSAPKQIWHGQQLADAFRHAALRLDAHRDEVNALNVFPVPDGDTGTNMAMTMHSATSDLPEGAAPVATVARLVTRGALLGARGNSGVILSQIFRGFADAIADRDEIDGRDLAAAIAGARDMAYKAVMRPVEGTMLTVIRGAAEAADAAARRSAALDTVLAAAIDGANNALATTPDLLPILKQAGVVDAGGRGIVIILEGMLAFNRGEGIDVTPPVAAEAVGANMAFLDQLADLHGEDAFGYCTNFLVVGQGIDFPAARQTIAAMGESAVIVGDDTLVKVHIHTEAPGKVLDYALTLGDLDQIKIDNMTLQTESLAEQRTSSVTTGAMPELPAAPPPIGSIAIVTVAAGEGLAKALQAMGAASIVSGGQTMNPSTEDLLRAVNDAPAHDVIVLPNNKNIIMAANQLQGLTDRNIRVVPTISVPEALAALSAFNASQTLDENIERMTSARSAVTTVELTRAVRDVEIDGLSISAGEVIALVDDVLKASASDTVQALTEAVSFADLDDVELVTVFAGADARDGETDLLLASLAELFPEAEIDSQVGGQPHYLYVIGIE